jgi:hypothetical protein
MTVFLVLVFGTLIAIVFAQLSGTRRVGELHASQLRALQERIEDLESAPPAGRGQAPAAAATAAPAAPPAAVPDVAGRSPIPVEPPNVREP